MAFTAVYGWAIERIAYRPLRGSFRLAPLISAIGMSIFLQNYVQLAAGRAAQAAAARSSTGGFNLFSADGFDVRVSLAADHHRRGDRGADGGLHLADRRARRSAASSAPASRT